MAALYDSSTSGIPVTVTFTQQAAECLGPRVIEAFTNADWRVNLPTQTSGTTVAISDLQDNLTRLDASGAIYTPAAQLVELQEQVVTLSATSAPGVPVQMVFGASAVQDLRTAFLNVFFEISPVGSQITISPPRIVGPTIVYDIIRNLGVAGPPYPEVVVRGYGRVAVIPAPTTS